MERRPELLSSVMLRQNPHNVHEWHKRAKLFQANPTKQILCYTGELLWEAAPPSGWRHKHSHAGLHADALAF